VTELSWLSIVAELIPGSAVEFEQQPIVSRPTHLITAAVLSRRDISTMALGH
jgi:hypothetical protein